MAGRASGGPPRASARGWRRIGGRCLATALLAGLLPAAAPAAGRATGLALEPCWLRGVETRALCGVLPRPLDPARPQGRSIDLHVAVLPALARNKKPDPVFFLAGGPGQSAIDIAGTVAALLARAANHRDIVLIDQRGTGRSAPLACDDQPPARGLREMADPVAQVELVARCRRHLETLPHGDLRHYTTVIAAQDLDAVRVALGASRINLVGGSYGTRVALETMRIAPAAVRRTVIDGVAPPDMVLPASFSIDAQAALDALLGWCAADTACAARFPGLASRWRALLAALPRTVTLPHPLAGHAETVTISRETVLGVVRTALYAPALAATLPWAITEAGDGRFEALIGLAAAAGGSRSRQQTISHGMHFSVLCAEDVPRLPPAGATPGGDDFGTGFTDAYRRICADWPRGEVPAAFYTLPPAPAATLVLSGGLDPVTPPRHGERVAQALGARARHAVVPNAGHGVVALPCLRDAVYRFIDADSDQAALAVDTGCARTIPRPPAFEPVRGEEPPR